MRPIFREQGSVESLAPGLKRMAYESLMVFTGNANPLLAHAVVRRLDIPLGHATVGKFSDGEILVELLENVRGKDCFVLQSTCAPANDSLMEVLLMVDALKRASAARVTAAIPYFGYARQDRRPRSARVAISAKVVANMLSSVGVARVLTMDLHADQIQGFFDLPVDNIYAAPGLLGDGWKQRYEKLIGVAGDVGGVVRARALAKRRESDLAIIDKRRPKANVSEVMNVIGEVKGRTCVIMDDMVDTAGTLVKAAQVLKEEGATKVVAYCTHAVLSGGSVGKIASSDMDELLRSAGKVPGILDGGDKGAVNIELDHQALYLNLRNERFHASILTLDLEGAKEPVLLRALNMHPFKMLVQHIDFQRVSKDKKIHMKVPLHFVNAEKSPGVKEQGGLVSHVLNELNVTCLPDDLPEFIEVDLGNLTVGHSVHARDLVLPKGVEAVLHKNESPVGATRISPWPSPEEEDAAAAAAAVAPSEIPTTEQAAEPKEGQAPAEGRDKPGAAKGAAST